MVDGLSLSWVSDRHLRVAVGSDTSLETHRRVRAVWEQLRAAEIESLRDLVPAYSTVLVEFDIARLDPEAAADAVRAALRNAGSAPPSPGRLVEIPVCYEGQVAPDIQDVARLHGMSVEDVAAIHAGAEYLVHFVGFVPGFAYLGGLPSQLETPRLSSPRVRVPAGSVGIAGDHTGVYPFSTPGGWRLIGRTPVEMFRADRERPSLLEMGDRVRFVRMSEEKFWQYPDPAPVAEQSYGDQKWGSVSINEGGMLTTVQDLGRPGHGAIGVCAGGAADPLSLRLGNRLVGNPEGAAGLELTLRGCEFMVNSSTVAVIVGARGTIAGKQCRDAEDCEVVRLGGVDTLKVVGIKGARAYICIAGGLNVLPVLGSASTHLSAGFGGSTGKALKNSDSLWFVSAERGARFGHNAAVARLVRETASRRTLRIVLNASGSEFDSAAINDFLRSEYKIASQSDRVGLRLDGGAKISSRSGGRMISEGMMWGAVQITESGRPIVLNVDYPVTGGYPVIGCVASVDLPTLGQLRPGDVVRFEAVTAEVARELYRDRERRLG